MEHHAAARTSHKVPPIPQLPDCLQEDPRFGLSQRVVAGRHFVKSPLLSKFFLFVVTETLAGRQSEITEHQIGVQVFGRSPGYLTVEDNIVRNYARQLRRRLAEHFADEGSAEPLRVEVPLGGYIPVFSHASGVAPSDRPHTQPMPIHPGTQPESGSPASSSPALLPPWIKHRFLLPASLLAAFAAVLISVTWFAA